MAWIFLPGGLLMPASVPASADKKFTKNGEFDLQVRGRVGSHLTNFIRDYVDPMGFAHSELEFTPQLDYNVRFYMLKTDFASAIGAAMLDIDYLKFKPTAETKGKDGKDLYADGRKYHDVLNAIWGSVTRLGAPGGKWTSSKPYKPSTKSRGIYDGATLDGYRPSQYPALGSTFFRDDELDEEEDFWERNDEIGDLLSKSGGLPTDQWEDYFDEREMKLLAPYLKDAQESERRLDALRREIRKSQGRAEKKTNKRNPRGRR